MKKVIHGVTFILIEWLYGPPILEGTMRSSKIQILMNVEKKVKPSNFITEYNWQQCRQYFCNLLACSTTHHWKWPCQWLYCYTMNLHFCKEKVRLPSKTDQRPWQDAENCPWDIFIWFDMSSYRKHWYLSFCSAHWLCFELTRATKYLLLPSFHLATQVILSTRKQYCRTLSKWPSISIFMILNLNLKIYQS